MAEHSNNLVTVKSNSSLQTETEAQNDTTEEEQSEKAFCPLLVCESTSENIPQNLQNIIENLSIYGGSETNKTDLLIAIVYILMIESGFVPNKHKNDFDSEDVGFHKGRVLTMSFLPQNWKKEDGVYNFEFVLAPYPEYICKMCCSVVNQSLIINFISKPFNILYCLYLEINRYISQGANKLVSQKFCNLNELSIEFKNKIALPAKQTILRAENTPCASIQDLPTEIYYNIFVNQGAVDFVRFKSTCKRLQHCAQFFEHELWKFYYKRDFPSSLTLENRSGLEEWFGKYQLQYLLENNRGGNPRINRVRKRPFLSFEII